MTESVKEIFSKLVTEWGWAIAIALLTIAMKDMLSKIWLGSQFLWGNDFNVDDIVYINGNKKARIVRQGIFKTTFYLYEHDRKFIIPNDRIWTLNIEKELPTENN